jgi:methylated-DNA-[protein]-cysteine S-methyltransferase
VSTSAIPAQRTLSTPIGPLGLAVGTNGLCFVDVRPDLTQSDEGSSDEADDIAGQLTEYLAGRRRRFDVRLDWNSTEPGFRRVVLQTLAESEFGDTMSYGELAARAGSPRAARAVGTAMATNPLAIVVPCHRVVRADGSIGGYGGGRAMSGVQMKQYLLDLERR